MTRTLAQGSVKNAALVAVTVGALALRLASLLPTIHHVSGVVEPISIVTFASAISPISRSTKCLRNFTNIATLVSNNRPGAYQWLRTSALHWFWGISNRSCTTYRSVTMRCYSMQSWWQNDENFQNTCHNTIEFHVVHAFQRVAQFHATWIDCYTLTTQYLSANTALHFRKLLPIVKPFRSITNDCMCKWFKENGFSNK